MRAAQSCPLCSAGACPSGHGVEGLLETPCVALFGLGERLEPVGNLVETLLARGTGHAGIHVGVFVRFARDRRFQVLLSRADRLASSGIAHLLEELEMTMGMAGLALRGRAEYR